MLHEVLQLGQLGGERRIVIDEYCRVAIQGVQSGYAIAESSVAHGKEVAEGVCHGSDVSRGKIGVTTLRVVNSRLEVIVFPRPSNFAWPSDLPPMDAVKSF
jgi:hypothetical protein